MPVLSGLPHLLLRVSLALAAGILVVSGLPPMRVDAGSGNLDTRFGVDGRVITPLGVSDRASALAIQPDGKVIAAGQSASRGIFYANDFALVRYNADGGLDMSFGSGGKVRTDFFGDEDYINAIALQADGRIVAAGRARRGADIYFGLARYNADGSLDATFGAGGKLVTSFAGKGDDAHALVIQADGKILVGGLSFVGSGDNTTTNFGDFGLARYNSDGRLDITFGAGGLVVTDFGNYDLITTLALRPDGKIIAGGSTIAAKTSTDFALARYNSDGSLDLSFGKNGKVRTDFDKKPDYLAGLVLQADGKIVAVGDVDTSPGLHTNDSQFGLARYDPDGSLDNTFGSDGKVVTAGNFIAARAVALQANGKIIAAGLARNPDTGGDFAVARYNNDGSLDPSFGSGGKMTTSFSGSDDAFALALLRDGSIIAAGTTYSLDLASGFALARYDNQDDRFDIRLQDDDSGSSLRLNSTTGEYLFTDCQSGFTLTGMGTLRVRACKITLEDSGADYFLSVQVKRCVLTGKAALQVSSQGKTFAIKDKDITSAPSPCP